MFFSLLNNAGYEIICVEATVDSPNGGLPYSSYWTAGPMHATMGYGGEFDTVEEMYALKGGWVATVTPSDCTPEELTTFQDNISHSIGRLLMQIETDIAQHLIHGENSRFMWTQIGPRAFATFCVRSGGSSRYLCEYMLSTGDMAAIHAEICKDIVDNNARPESRSESRLN